MIGIYKITNLENNKCYIGQSKDLEKRKYQHWHNNQTEIGRLIQKNPNNFKFEVLEECTIDELDEKEKYYTLLFNSVELGYNNAIVKSLPGDMNSNNKLSSFDVLCIRMDYNNHCNKREVFEKYKDKISWRGFEKIWFGETWPNILMSVYNDENKYYYTHDAKANAQEKTFTDSEVLEFRKRYANETGREIYNSINGSKRCTYYTFERALIGMDYKHIPIYKKKEGIWIRSL